MTQPPQPVAGGPGLENRGSGWAMIIGFVLFAVAIFLLLLWQFPKHWIAASKL